MRLLPWIGVLSLLSAVAAQAAPALPAGAARARQLKEALAKEKPQFDIRESQRRDALEELDRLNSDQNRVRERLRSILGSQQELTMALDNLAVEAERQRTAEQEHKNSLLLLLKVVNKVRRDGTLRFLVNGDDLSQIASRVRVLFRTIRAQSTLARQLGDRTRRLAESERKLGRANEEMQHILSELSEQEALLGSLLLKKRQVLTAINRKQGRYQAMVKEYRQVSQQLSMLFENFESIRGDALAMPGHHSLFPSRASLPLPLDSGTIVSQFGRSVHRTFQTVTYRKGIEIEADQFAPVHAVLGGVIEYEGWVKGLGNVVIVHHGGGFYTLSAHLHKSTFPKGARVSQGDTIGLVGDTGSSERSSLYFEIRENGKAVDPVTYFSPRALAVLN